MENKSHALLAGLFTVALLIAAVFFALWFNRDRVNRVPYEMVTRLPVSGLNPQATVRYRGLGVGKVDSIGFNPQHAGEILVRISVDPQTPITQSTFGTLGYQGVTGIAFVQLDDDGSKPALLASDPSHPARIEIRPSILDNIQTRSAAILQQTEALTANFNALLAPANQQKIVGAIDHIGSAAAALEALPKQLEPTLEKLPALADNAQQTLASVSALSRDAGALAADLTKTSRQLQAPGGALTRITDTADHYSAIADSIERDALPRINALANEARSSMQAINRNIEKLGENPQSILLGAPDLPPGPGEPGFGGR
ncbi:MlaD family protein [Herminiimonas sp. CN]|uniref:MlaD family protein n=1 Tax=Herminiimonas sp. CN TaxID=1349818 RepID=UPI000473EB5B|nr:MlaD family protein [Herminiimonas sp. CN]